MSVPAVLTMSAEQDEEARWIEEARRDRRAFAHLYRRYLNPVYRYLATRVGDAHAAQDLTSQVFVAVLEGLPHYQHRGHFAAWLFSIARRKAIDYYRSSSGELSLEALPDLPDPLDDPLRIFLQTSTHQQIARMLQSMGEEDRELIRLRFMAGLSFPEIALVLQHKESAVKMKLYRLLERMERELEVAHDA